MLSLFRFDEVHECDGRTDGQIYVIASRTLYRFSLLYAVRTIGIIQWGTDLFAELNWVYKS